MQLFHLPLLSQPDLGFIRVGGPGLGNLLFPIARALIGRERLGGTFVYPTMRQIKLGPILRREPDKRIYGRVLRGRSFRDWRDWLRIQRLAKADEDAALPGEGALVVTYTGMRRYFHDLAGRREHIAAWLTANRYRGAKPRPREYDIAVHVRLGDFAASSSDSSDPSIQLPLAWYRSALVEARGLASTASPRILLFTDGDVDAVRKGLEIGGIDIDCSADALTAMQRISACPVLVASRSTFSMWGTYLGDTAAVWDKRFDLATYFPARAGRDVLV